MRICFETFLSSSLFNLFLQTSLRSADVRILGQLVALHEGIEAMHWLMEERGSMSSLLEEDDIQHGSWTSPRWSSKPRYRSVELHNAHELTLALKLYANIYTKHYFKINLGSVKPDLTVFQLRHKSIDVC